MGIRFRCHQCGHELHVKDFQGGKRSRCPECDTRFRIPSESAELSIPLDNALTDDSAVRSAASSLGSTGTLASKAASAKSSIASPVSSTPVSSKATAAVANEKALAEKLPSGKAAAPSLEEPTTNEVAAPSAEQAGAPGALMQLRAIAEAPSATWYVRPPAGGQYGPAPANVFCEWLTESRVTRDSLVWRDGWPQWLMASEAFPEYFGPSYAATAQVPGPLNSPIAPAPVAHSPAAYSPVSEQTGASEFVAPVTLSDRTLAARKRQRKKNYMIMIGVLATISIGLVVALVLVLMQNA